MMGRFVFLIFHCVIYLIASWDIICPGHLTRHWFVKPSQVKQLVLSLFLFCSFFQLNFQNQVHSSWFSFSTVIEGLNALSVWKPSIITKFCHGLKKIAIIMICQLTHDYKKLWYLSNWLAKFSNIAKWGCSLWTAAIAIQIKLQKQAWSQFADLEKKVLKTL